MTKPIVDGLRQRFSDRVDFASVDLTQAAGQAIAKQYGARVGTFIVFDGAGRELARPWCPSVEDIQRALESR